MVCTLYSVHITLIFVFVTHCDERMMKRATKRSMCTKWGNWSRWSGFTLGGKNQSIFFLNSLMWHNCLVLLFDKIQNYRTKTIRIELMTKAILLCRYFHHHWFTTISLKFNWIVCCRAVVFNHYLFSCLFILYDYR